MNRIVLLVLDGVGVGAAPGAHGPAAESNTLSHVMRVADDVRLPTLAALGLGHIGAFPGVAPSTNPDGCFGKMAPVSAGTDSITGHWELAGIVVRTPFPTYPDGFPPDVIALVEQAAGRAVIGNRAASGTAIIQELGDEHLKTGALIVYTSADSVLQIAAHDAVVAIPELHRICRAVRKALKPPHTIGRVIARPFTGSPGAFVRVEGRRDFGVEPPAPTMLDEVKRAGHPVVGIGKIEDLFAGRGLTRSVHAESQAAVFDQLQRTLATMPRGLIAANFVEFDSHYGHRKDAIGFAAALQTFDRALPAVIDALRPGDALIVTGDHGTDPTVPGTDHTREYVPLLAYGPRLGRGVSLGVRATFADVGQTVVDALGANMLSHGESFLDALQPG
jgi:phosphopentomutase